MPAAKKTAPKTAAPAAATEDTARRIWLASVGAYGRLFQEAQGQVEKVAGTANEAFDQLVARGEAVEHIVRAKIAENETAQKVAGVVEQIGDFRAERRAALEARVETVRKAVGETIAPFNPLALMKTVQTLQTRVDALEAEVARLKRPARKTAKA